MNPAADVVKSAPQPSALSDNGLMTAQQKAANREALLAVAHDLRATFQTQKAVGANGDLANPATK